MRAARSYMRPALWRAASRLYSPPSKWVRWASKRLNVYLRNRGHGEAWRRLTLDELAGADPAIVETTVLDCGPYESCLFELDAVGEASRATK